MSLGVDFTFTQWLRLGMDKLLNYLNGLPKSMRPHFAATCGTTEGYLRKAISCGQLLGTAVCVSIERESAGAVTRQDLRPDDWLANWPELAYRAPVPT